MGMFNSFKKIVNEVSPVLGPIGKAVSVAGSVKGFFEKPKNNAAVAMARDDSRIQRLSKDARKAGIHPLAALGAGMPSTPTFHIGNSKGEALENVGKALTAAGNQPDKAAAAKIRGLEIAGREAEIELTQARTRTAIAQAEALMRGDPDPEKPIHGSGTKVDPWKMYGWYVDENGKMYLAANKENVEDPEQLITPAAIKAMEMVSPSPGDKKPKVERIGTRTTPVTRLPKKGKYGVLYAYQGGVYIWRAGKFKRLKRVKP